MTSVPAHIPVLPPAEVLQIPGAVRIRFGRNSPPMYEQSEDCPSVYVVEAGFVKLLRRGPASLDAPARLARAGGPFGGKGLFWG